jgi:hypothetical protein
VPYVLACARLTSPVAQRVEHRGDHQKAGGRDGGVNENENWHWQNVEKSTSKQAAGASVTRWWGGGRGGSSPAVCRSEPVMTVSFLDLGRVS